MIWFNKKFTVTGKDLEILRQAGSSVTEVVQAPAPCGSLPALWSVFSYVMLQEHGASPKAFWSRYREFRKTAAQRDTHYRILKIPKSGGGMRTLAVPDRRLRYYQQFIARHILRHLPTDPHAYAYCRGRNIRDCALPHEGAGILVHMDIQNFFPSITEEMIRHTLQEETPYKHDLCSCLARLCCFRGKLPQGACTSPAISNLVFRRCDESLAMLAASHGMHYTRYSDDMFFSGTNCNAAALISEVRQLLKRYGFTLNEAKTRVQGKQHRQSVLGLTVNEKLQTCRTYRRQILQQVHYVERFGENCRGALLDGSYKKHLHRLLGQVTYVLHADPDNKTFREVFHKLDLRLRQVDPAYPQYHR